MAKKRIHAAHIGLVADVTHAIEQCDCASSCGENGHPVPGLVCRLIGELEWASLPANRLRLSLPPKQAVCRRCTLRSISMPRL